MCTLKNIASYWIHIPTLQINVPHWSLRTPEGICSDQQLQLIPMSSPHPADTRTSDIGHGASSRQPLAASGLTFNAQMP